MPRTRHSATPAEALEAVYALNASDPLGMVDERLHLAAAGLPPLADDDDFDAQETSR